MGPHWGEVGHGCHKGHQVADLSPHILGTQAREGGSVPTASGQSTAHSLAWPPSPMPQPRRPSRCSLLMALEVGSPRPGCQHGGGLTRTLLLAFPRPPARCALTAETALWRLYQGRRSCRTELPAMTLLRDCVAPRCFFRGRGASTAAPRRGSGGAALGTHTCGPSEGPCPAAPCLC